MDDFDDDAYPVIYDEQDRERQHKSPKPICGVLLLFIIMAVIL